MQSMTGKEVDRLSLKSGDEHFEEWLSVVEDTYRTLNPRQQAIAIKKLLRVSCPEQRYILEKEISSFLHQDILVSLPRELQEFICNYIDVSSLFTACCVSKDWNRIISSLSNIWKSKGNQLGISLVDNGEIDWKKECLSALRVIEGMQNGFAFQHKKFPATCLTLDHVTGLYYSDGLLVGSAEDQVGIWRTLDYELVSLFSVPYRISCLQLSLSTLVFGHTNGFLTAWNVKANGWPSSGNNRSCSTEMFREFHDHTGVVMSVSICPKLDLLVSGSTDFTAKLWSVKNGTLIKTLSGHTHWIIQVSLVPALDRISILEEHMLITKTRASIHLFSWPKHSPGNEKDSCGDIASIESSMKVVTLHPVGNFITSGCHISGKNLVFIRQIWTEEGTNGAEVLFQDVENMECTKKVHLQMNIRKLLAVGKVFALVLLPWNTSNKYTLTVVNIVSGKIVGGCNVPHSSSSTPDLAQITVGDISWCDGLTFLKAGDIVVGLGLPNGMIHVVTWQDLRICTE